MKIFLLLFFVFFTGITSAQALYFEDFNYPQGDALTSHNWVQSGTVVTNILTASTPGLSFPQYRSTGTSACFLNNTGQDVYANFTTPVTSGSVYLSFLMNVQTALTGDYFIAISPSTAQTNYYARTHIKSSGNGYVMGMSKTNELAGGAVYGTTVLNFNSTYLVVVKYIFNTGTTADDAIRMYVFPFAGGSPASEPSTSEIGTYVLADVSKLDATDLGSVTLRQGTATSAPTMIIDGVRVTTSFATATDVAKTTDLPNSFELSQNYPNPFNPSTVIKYQVPQNTFVNVNVYDVLGNHVRTLVREEKAAGSYELKFDAGNMTSGIYFYSIQAGAFTQTKKMILMK